MPAPIAFVTGIAGFAGSYLANELLDHGYEVAGSLLRGEPIENIRPVRKRLELVELDIADERRCRDTLVALKPRYVFHLAAMTSVRESFEMQRQTYRVNFEGTLNLLQASRLLKNLRKFVFVSSADCYGAFRPKSRVLTEDQPLNPISPYGISKAAAEHLCQMYHRRFGLPVAIARAFNHSGPRQSDRFVVPAFAKQVAAIEADRQPPIIRVGSLTVRRDLSDVRDIVVGYRLLAERGRPGEVYHLCSGKTVAIGTILNMLRRLSERNIGIGSDKRLIRKADIRVLRGSNHKAVKELGYAVHHPLRQTLRDTLDYYRQQYA
jgi:GDP-4-dehydro-6-deoxy-D-mannose reductase